MAVNEANECVGREQSDDLDDLGTTIDFFCRLGLPERCFPVERWTDIVQVLSDWSGYTVGLRAHLLEPAPEVDGLRSVGHKDVLTAAPNLFVVTDKCDCCKHTASEDNCRKQ
jgi:hypothetical protein